MRKKFAFFGKKAIQLSLWTLVEILILILIVLPLFVFITDVSKNRFFERSALSKDYALLINTVQSVPGDVFYSYSHSGIDMREYDFLFSDNEISVANTKDPSHTDIIAAGLSENTYPYYNDNSLANVYDRKITAPQNIDMMKTKNSLQIGKNVEQIFGVMACPAAKPDSAKIVFVHIIYNDQKALRAADYLSKSFELRGISSLTAPYESYKAGFVDNKPALLETTDMVLLISIREIQHIQGSQISQNTEEESAEKCSIFYSNQESFALACRIRNAYHSEGFFEGRVYIGTGGEKIGEISEDKIGIEIAVAPDNANIFSDSQFIEKLIKPILESLESYKHSAG